jgi:hypothetical protein
LVSGEGLRGRRSKTPNAKESGGGAWVGEIEIRCRGPRWVASEVGGEEWVWGCVLGMGWTGWVREWAGFWGLALGCNLQSIDCFGIGMGSVISDRT